MDRGHRGCCWHVKNHVVAVRCERLRDIILTSFSRSLSISSPPSFAHAAVVLRRSRLSLARARRSRSCAAEACGASQSSSSSRPRRSILYKYTINHKCAYLSMNKCVCVCVYHIFLLHLTFLHLFSSLLSRYHTIPARLLFGDERVVQCARGSIIYLR